MYPYRLIEFLYLFIIFDAYITLNITYYFLDNYKAVFIIYCHVLLCFGYINMNTVNELKKI